MDDNYNLNLDTSGYQQSMAAAMGTTSQFTNALGSLSTGSARAGQAISVLTLPVRLLEKGFGGFSNQAAEAQTQLSQLRATSTVTGQSVRALSTEADKLARAFPVTNAGAVQLVTQLQALGVSGAGSEARIGQLGKTMIQLASATGSSTGQITQSMVGISRAFGDNSLDPKRISRFSDSLTTLVGKFGGTASGITAFTQNIAPFARQAGIGESATLGIAGAFSKLGDDGASAATAVNKILGDINKSVRDGGPQINTYANIVGKTADQFRNLAKSNPAEALSQVVDALGKGAEGQRGLERLGLDGVRTQRALSALSQGGELRAAINTSVGAYGNGSTEKASKAALEGLNNALTTLQSTGEQLAIVLGTPILGGLTAFAHALQFPVSLLNSLAGSTGGHGVMTAVGDLGLAMLLKKTFIGAGNASAGLGLLGSNSLARGFSAGRRLEQVGGDTKEGWATAWRSPQTTDRQMRSLRAYAQLQMEDDLATRNGTSLGPMHRGGLTAAQYALQRPSASKLAMQERRDETFHRQSKLYGPMAAYGLEQQRTEADAALGKNQAKRGFIQGARPYSQYQMLKGYSLTSLQRTYNEDDNFARGNVDTPKGAYAGPWARMKGAFDKDLVGDQGGPAKLTDRLKAMSKASGEASQHMNTLPTGKVLRDITAAQWMPVKESAKSIGRFGASVGSAAGGLVGGLPGVALMGGLYLGGKVASTISDGNARRKQFESDISSMSTTKGIDAYRDSVGLATANTVTMADQMQRVAKVLDVSAVQISGAGKLTANELSIAADSRNKVVNSYRGNDSQIANQIGALSLGGMSAAEQSAVRVDLARQFSPTRANSIIAQTDWAGANMTNGVNSQGTLTDKYISGAVGQTKDTFSKVGDSRNLIEKAGSALQWSSRSGRIWAADAHVRKGTQDQISAVAQTMGQVYTTQSDQYGQAYAKQNQLQSANKIIKEALKQGVSDDQLKATEATLSGSMGYKTEQFSRRDYANGANFTDLLGNKDGRLRGDIAGLGPGASVISGGLSALAQQSPLAKAMAQVGGSYGAMFDNTKPTAASQATDASLALPTDANLLDKAITAIVDGGTKAGMSLNDVAAAAGKAGAKLNGDETLPAWQLQEGVRQRALQQQSFGDAFRSPGATIALSLQTHMADASNTGTDPASVKRRQDAQAGEAQDAANLRGIYVQRIEADRAYQIQTSRSSADFHLSMSNQTTDFLQGQQRAEFDYHEGVSRANRNYQQQTLRAEEDFHITRYRQQRDFATQMARGAEDAASSMYAPYQRIAVQQVWDGRALQVNMAEQVDALRKQQQNLAQLRRQGVSDQTIRQLDLTNTANSQQLGQLVGDTGHDKGLAALLNSTSAAKASVSSAIYNDKDNTAVQRSKEDFQKSLADQVKDFQKSARRTAFDFKQSLGDQYADYTKTVQRGEEDFRKAQDREVAQFQLSMSRMHDDLINSRKVIDGDLASLQKAANKGIANSEADWSKIMGDGLNKAQAALNRFAPGYLQTLQQLYSGVASLAGAPTGGGSSGGGGTPPPNAFAAPGVLGATNDKRTPEAGSIVTDPGGYNAGAAAHGDTRSLIYDIAAQAGVAGITVTATTNGVHSKTSYHYKKEAIDFDGGPAANLKLAQYIAGLNKAGRIHATELIYEDPKSNHDYAIKYGKFVDGQKYYGAVLMGEHRNHVHFALDAADAAYAEQYFSPPSKTTAAQAARGQRGGLSTGGIVTAPVASWVGEGGSHEAVIPLNSQGVAALAAAMSKYMSTSDHKSMTTAGSKTYVHYDYSTTHEDHSTKIMGPVTVKAESPTDLGKQLHRKQRLDNLTGASRG